MLLAVIVSGTSPPVPVKPTLMVGLAGSFDLITRVAALASAYCGVKTTLTVQDAPAIRVVPQVLAEMEKSAALTPAIPMLIRVSGAPPPFESVTVCAALSVR